MLAADVPSKIQLPFAIAGTKNTIPVPSQIAITPGAASYTDGFPPITFLDIVAGGIPPDGADVNGVLYAITNVQRWQSAGGIFRYDSAFSTAIGGYPKGAILQSSTEDISWLCLADNNTTDPDGVSAANWAALSAYGIGAVTGLTNANVTLTPAQYAFPVLTLAGTLSGNVQIIFPALKQKWLVLNNTTGDFTVTCKTAAGTGATVPHGGMQEFYGDGTNIVPTLGDSRYAGAMPSVTVSAVANDLVCTLKAPCKLDFRNPSLASGLIETLAITSDLTLTVPNGATLGMSNGVAARLPLLVAYNGGSPVLCINNQSGGLQLDGSNLISPTTISTAADLATVIYSASAVSANSPYVVVAAIDITEATAGTWATAPSAVVPLVALTAMSGLGYGQTEQDVTASRALNTTYYGGPKPRMVEVVVALGVANGSYVQVVKGGVSDGAAIQSPYTNGHYKVVFMVRPFESYSIVPSNTVTIVKWVETF